jgi:predicted RNA-binding Zn-ribbon protein involved in translation (DUF1610 family)
MGELADNPGCLGFIQNLFGSGAKVKITGPVAPEPQPIAVPIVPAPEPHPYRIRDDFLSRAELSFFLVVKNMVRDSFVVLTKVNLADIFYVIRPNENSSAYNKISRKHVDFLVCDPKTLAPLCGIELDDRSHNRPDRQERDEFVEAVFKEAGLPLLRIPVQASYNTTELGLLFKDTLKQGTHVQEYASAEGVAAPDPRGAGVPYCPKCGQPMVLRTARNGAQAGQQFYGCVDYPKCRGVVPIPVPG